jgi:peptidase M1-like protein
MVTMLLAGFALGAPGLAAQSAMADANPAAPPASDALATYRQFLNPVLNTADVHHVRELSIDREDLHIVLTDGTIGLIQAVDGHITGAFFEGEGHILLIPPNRAERSSLALFTRAGVLEQTFTVAYLRFFDDKLVEELRAGFRPTENAQEFIDKWKDSMSRLARSDSLQLLQAITAKQEAASTFLRLRLAGVTLGIFDVVFDTHAPEQISVAQTATSNDGVFYDSWNAFPMRSVRQAVEKRPARPEFDVSDYKLRNKLSPPTDLSAEAEVTLTPRITGQRTIIFELSRYLKLTEVRVNGQPADFIQNDAIDGSDLARRGNDLIAVVLASATQKGTPLRLAFRYSGPVMADAGGDLIIVGDRGTWYPNLGPWFAHFDMTFEYPTGWTVVATGKQVSSDTIEGQQVSRFVTEKPITYAGFNLGKFEAAGSSAGDVAIHVYGARTVEQMLARKEATAGLHPNPTKEVQRIADDAAATVTFISHELEPFPYSHLEVTQLPALISQSWPGLIYLSSMAYLDPRERRALGVQDPFLELLLRRLMLTHEAAHQWWGDAVNAGSYHDEWIIEALANYTALLMLEQEDPKTMKVALEHYRTELLRETPNGIVADAGPVTLGYRLVSSKFPKAFEPVLYGRGTWLLHTIRSMLRQASGGKNDALFYAALKELLTKSTNHKISALDLQHAFEQVLPPSLHYEKKKSLDWFFDSWVNGTSVPQFSLDKVKMTPVKSGLRVTGVIREQHAARDLVTAVPVFSVQTDGSSRFLAFVFVDEEETEFTLSAPAGTKDLVLDPQGTLLRR